MGDLNNRPPIIVLYYPTESNDFNNLLQQE